jgi:hypothetical protein
MTVFLVVVFVSFVVWTIARAWSAHRERQEEQLDTLQRIEGILVDRYGEDHMSEAAGTWGHRTVGEGEVFIGQLSARPAAAAMSAILARVSRLSLANSSRYCSRSPRRLHYDE